MELKCEVKKNFGKIISFLTHIIDKCAVQVVNFDQPSDILSNFLKKFEVIKKKLLPQVFLIVRVKLTISRQTILNSMPP